jgi:hypothetical protein
LVYPQHGIQHGCFGARLEAKMVLYQGPESTAFNQYGLPPFVANQNLTKLTTWDAPPLEAEVEAIKPLLTRIQSLKSATGDRLIGTHLMAFFLQRRIQPLQARAAKLWSYFGSTDPSQVADQDPEKKNLNKRRHIVIITNFLLKSR